MVIQSAALHGHWSVLRVLENDRVQNVMVSSGISEGPKSGHMSDTNSLGALKFSLKSRQSVHFPSEIASFPGSRPKKTRRFVMKTCSEDEKKSVLQFYKSDPSSSAVKLPNRFESNSSCQKLSGS